MNRKEERWPISSCNYVTQHSIKSRVKMVKMFFLFLSKLIANGLMHVGVINYRIKKDYIQLFHRNNPNRVHFCNIYTRPSQYTEWPWLTWHWPQDMKIRIIVKICKRKKQRLSFWRLQCSINWWIILSGLTMGTFLEKTLTIHSFFEL